MMQLIAWLRKPSRWYARPWGADLLWSFSNNNTWTDKRKKISRTPDVSPWRSLSPRVHPPNGDHMRRYRCAINDHGQQVPNPVTTLLGEECLARRSTHKDFNRSVKHDVLVVAVNDRLERLQTNKRIILLSAWVFQKKYFKRLSHFCEEKLRLVMTWGFIADLIHLMVCWCLGLKICNQLFWWIIWLTKSKLKCSCTCVLLQDRRQIYV